MRIAAPTTPEQVDTDTRRAVAELQRAARSNASLAAVVDALVAELYGDASNTTRPIALVKRSTAGGPATGVDTIETFDQALINNDGMYDASLPDRLTIQTPGIYISFAQNHFTSNGTGLRAIDILALGTSPTSNAIGANSDSGISSGPNLMQAVGAPVPLDAGSALYLNLFQSSGGSLATLTTYGGCWMAAVYLAPMP